MTRSWNRHRSTRAGAGRRAVLRTELFRELFLPPAEEIADPSRIERLELPATLALWPPPGSERQRIALARAQVARFPAANHQQAQLRRLVLEMLDYMRRELLGPGEEAALDRWWTAVRAYRRVLALPVMATPKARRLLPRLLDARWPEVERAAAAIERKWRPRQTEAAPRRPAAGLYLSPGRSRC